MTDRTEDVIIAALVTQVEVHAKRIVELEANVQHRRSRQSQLRIALANLLTLPELREDPQIDRYRAVLDAENDN